MSAFYSLMMAGFAALLAVEIIPSDPTSTPSPEEQWPVVWFLLAAAAGLIGWAVWIARRQLREHPSPPAQQSTEASLAPD